MMERLSELESENLMSRLREGPWERIIMDPDSYREEKRKGNLSVNS